MSAVSEQLRAGERSFLDDAGHLVATPGRHDAVSERVRRRGLAAFAECGLPTVHLEDWIYADTQAITRQTWARPRLDSCHSIRDKDVLPHTFGDQWAASLVFVDGRFVSSLSTLPKPRAGVRITTLLQALADDSSRAASWFGNLSRPEGRGFTALNTALFADGAFIYLGPEQVLDNPIQILHLSTASDSAYVMPRHLMIAERGSQVCIVENYASLGALPCFTNTLSEVFVGENADVKHVKLQRENESSFHVGEMNVHIEKNGRYANWSVSVGAAWARHDIVTRQNGQNVFMGVDGLYVVRGEQFVDHHTTIDHAYPHGTSSQVYKGILDGRSTGVFNGKVLVRQDAQKTDASQNNRNLLLSNDAVINTKPQLEIFADDVKCAHGATIGQLDEAALFYLRSRGISEAAARDLLTFAFAADLIETLPVPTIRHRLASFLATRFSHDTSAESPES